MTEQPPGALPDPSPASSFPPPPVSPPPGGAVPEPPPAAIPVPPVPSAGAVPPPAPPAQPYGQPMGYAPMAPKHPSAATALVLGIIGLAGGFLTCGSLCVLSPFAWIAGAKALREIRASQGTLTGESEAKTARTLGIIGTVLLGLVILGWFGFTLFSFIRGVTDADYPFAP